MYMMSSRDMVVLQSCYHTSTAQRAITVCNLEYFSRRGCYNPQKSSEPICKFSRGEQRLGCASYYKPYSQRGKCNKCREAPDASFVQIIPQKWCLWAEISALQDWPHNLERKAKIYPVMSVRVTSGLAASAIMQLKWRQVEKKFFRAAASRARAALARKIF